MKEADLDAVRVSRGDDRGLRLVKRPLAGQDPAIFVAIAVSDHYLLDWPALRQGKNLRAIRLVVDEAALGNRMRQKSIDQRGAALQVVERFEEGDDGKDAEQSLLRPAHEPGFPRQKVDHQKIRKPACHAHDQSADSLAPVVAEVPAENAVAGKHRVRLFPDIGGVVEKRAGRLELLVEKIQATRLFPFAEVGGGLPDRGENLNQRLLVELAVLSDVESGQVKTENVEGAPHRPDGVVRQPAGANLGQSLTEEGQIFVELVGAPVLMGSFVNRRGIPRALGQWKLRLQEHHVLPPRLVGMLPDDRFGVRILRSQSGNALLEDFRGLLKVARERKPFRQFFEMTVDDDEGVQPHVLERLLGDFGRHKGMPIPVAANPASKPDTRPDMGVFE